MAITPWGYDPGQYGTYKGQQGYAGQPEHQEDPWAYPQGYRDVLRGLAPEEGPSYGTGYQLDTLGKQTDQSVWKAGQRIGSASDTASARIGMYGGRSASDKELLEKQKTNATASAGQGIRAQQGMLGQGILGRGEAQKREITSGLYDESIGAWASKQKADADRLQGGSGKSKADWYNPLSWV